MRRRAEDLLSQSVMTLAMAEPFFGHVLTGLNRRLDDSTPTAGVAIERGRVLLRVNPTFFTRTLRRKGQRVAVLKHEVLHVLLRHVERLDDRPGTEPALWNIAADLVVNQLVGRRWELPSDAITLDALRPVVALPPDLTVREYYALLAPERETATLARLLDDSHSDHGGWGAVGTDAALAATEVCRLATRARHRAGSSYGTLPSTVREMVDQLVALGHPQVDWRRVLRLFAASSRRSHLHGTLRRPSKRYGTFPGHRVRRHARLVIAIDTSASISHKDLQDFFTEVQGIWRQGAEVTIVECDAAVQRTWTYAGRPPKSVQGRGGTSFDPVLAWMRERRGERWDGLVYLTDGYAAQPSIPPLVPTLWVLTRHGGEAPAGIGRAIRLGA